MELEVRVGQAVRTEQAAPMASVGPKISPEATPEARLPWVQDSGEAQTALVNE